MYIFLLVLYKFFKYILMEKKEYKKVEYDN